jgi:hypothetical protein
MTTKWFTQQRLFMLPLMLFLFAAGAYAQQNSEITGTVTDKQGAVVSGAKITLTQPSTGLTKDTVSNDSGLYDFPGLNIGTYDLKVMAPGFETVVQQGLELNVSQTLRSDISLTVGAVNETVTVAANALQVQADSNVVSTLISGDQITELATENRNFAALAALGLGVSSALPTNNTPTSVAASFTISVNGLRQSHNIWLIDGGEADDRGGAGGANIMPSQDAIQQFETLTSNYPPDYGISSGATISLGLKSGTQKFHGSLWEFNRNTVYDANDYFNKQNDQARLKLIYNIFGFNGGGPVFVPKYYNTSRQRTFFFVNQEWRRLVQGSTPNSVATLPAADFPVAGQNLTYVPPAFTFTATTPAGNQIKVPKIGDPAFNAKLAALGLTPGGAFPGNVVPSALFDPNAVLYLNSGVVPKPTNSSGYNVSSANQPITVWDTVIRIDHRITDKWQILGHWLNDEVTQAYASPMLGWSGASYPTVTSTLQNPSNGALVKLTGTINPTLLVEASFNYDGNVINIVNSSNSLTPSGWSVNRFFGNSSKNLPNMSWGAPYSTNENPGSAPWKNAARDYSPIFSVSYTQGKHAMKFGVGYNRYTKNQQLFGDPGGNFSWGSQSGDAFLDMILGLASNYDQAEALPVRHYVNNTTSVYALDNWHVSPRLSLQLGFRYDALPHAWERNNQIANFDPGQYLTGQAPTFESSGALDPTGPGFINVNGGPFYQNGIYIAGQNGYPKGLVTNDYGTLQPRVGFSDDLFGDGKTVLRGGFGTFYERLQGNDIYNAATNEPFFNDPSASSVYFSDPHTTWTTGSTATLPFFPQGLTTLDRTYKAPAVAQFSLGIQREIQPSLILVVQYVGNIAWHQNIDRNINNYSINTAVNATEAANAPYHTPGAADNALYNRANAGDSSNNAPQDPCNPKLPATPANCPNSSIPVPNILRNYQGYAGITQQENTTNGNYNGFQTGLRAQGKHGLSGEIDYTWSHEIDITTYDLGQVSNPYNIKYDKGSGALDRRNILSLNYIYAFPFFNSYTGLKKTLIGGWELSGTFVAESGTIIANQGPGLGINYDPIGLGGGYTNRPDITGKISYPKQQKQWFSTSAFAAPIPVWAGGVNQGFGDTRKDAVLGPGRTNFDTSLFKTFVIKEGIDFKFRLESFNTFNHTQFNSVGTSFNNGSGNFGQATNTWGPRVLELGAQLRF